MIDRPDVRDAVERSADPAWARVALERLLDAHRGLDDQLAHDATLLDALVAVSVASRSLFVALERDRGAVEMLCADALGGSISFADARELIGREDPASELRRWKRRQVARIAARDLLGVSDLREVAGELADLAAACLEVALAVAAPQVPMSIIGMGKLGGGELNYASDVDVLFVHEGDGETEAAERAARAVLRVMGTPSPDGIGMST